MTDGIVEVLRRVYTLAEARGVEGLWSSQPMTSSVEPESPTARSITPIDPRAETRIGKR